MSYTTWDDWQKDSQLHLSDMVSRLTNPANELSATELKWFSFLQEGILKNMLSLKWWSPWTQHNPRAHLCTYLKRDSPHLTKFRTQFAWKTFPTIPNIHQHLQVRTAEGTCDWGIHYHIHLSFTKQQLYTALEVAKVSSYTSSCSTAKHVIIPVSHVSTALSIIICSVEVYASYCNA